jgi:hypothetical protein
MTPLVQDIEDCLRKGLQYKKYRTVGVKLFLYLFFFPCGTAAQRGLWPPHSRGFRDHTHVAPQSVGLLWASDQFAADTST